MTIDQLVTEIESVIDRTAHSLKSAIVNPQEALQAVEQHFEGLKAVITKKLHGIKLEPIVLSVEKDASAIKAKIEAFLKDL